MQIDQPDDGDRHADAADAPTAANAAGDRDRPAASDAGTERKARIAQVMDHRANVDAAYRAYAIDQAYERVREIERGTVTPAMKRIEAEDPDRHLAGLE